MRLTIFLTVLLGLAACTTTTAPNTGGSVSQPVSQNAYPQGLDDTCGAVSYAVLIGQDGTALERILILREVRVIRPGSIVTQDYSPERLNFRINESGVISELTCG
jgi:hypothetical protein